MEISLLATKRQVCGFSRDFLAVKACRVLWSGCKFIQAPPSIADIAVLEARKYLNIYGSQGYISFAGE